MIEPDILVETDKSGKSNLEFEIPKKEKPNEQEKKEPAKGRTKMPQLAFNKILIRKGLFTYKEGRSGSTYTVRLDSLSADSADIQTPIKLGLDGAYNKKHFELTGTLGPLAALIDPNKQWSVDLKAKAGGATLVADGSIMDPLKLGGIKINFTVNGKEFTQLESLIGKVPPLKGPFEISGRVDDLAQKTYRISDLNVTLSDSDLNGFFELTLTGDRPVLKAGLSSKKLNLQPILQDGQDKAAEEVRKKQIKREKIFSDKPLPFGELMKTDAALKIDIGQLLLPKMLIENINTEMILKEGHFRIKPLKATIGGGNLLGHLDLNPQGKDAAVAVAVKVDLLDLGQMLKELKITEILEGEIDIDIDLKSRGGSLAELMGGLNGDISAMMGKARIANRYIDLIGADLSSSIFRLLNPEREGMAYTDINCFVSRFHVKEGLAETIALVFDTRQMSVIGDGKVNLRTEKLDLALKPVPKKGMGKVSLSLGELAKPFKLGGTLANPSLAIDPTQAAITIGKAVSGVTLFGPVGIAASLLSGSAGEDNPCLAAIKAAETGVKVTEEEKQGDIEGEVEQTVDAVKEGIKGIGKGFKKLFRN